MTSGSGDALMYWGVIFIPITKKTYVNCTYSYITS